MNISEKASFSQFVSLFDVGVQADRYGFALDHDVGDGVAVGAGDDEGFAG